eukprot:204529_1
MTDSRAGDTDGVYNGQRYFECSPKRGIFMVEERIQRVITSEELLNKLVTLNEQKKMLDEENKNYEVMADLYLNKSKTWKEQFKNLEIAHDELESEVEFLKRQLMLFEQHQMRSQNDFIAHPMANDNKVKAKPDQNCDPFEMISLNDLSALKEYISTNKHIINAFNDPQKGNLSIWAVRCNNINAIKILHEFDADLDQDDDLGWTPLIYCCIHNNYPMAELLLKCECDVEGVDYGCWSPVIFCCLLHHDEILKLLAKHDANMERFVYANKNPLILCAERGFFKCLQVLKDEDVELMDAFNIVKQSNHRQMTAINRKKAIQVLNPKKK